MAKFVFNRNSFNLPKEAPSYMQDVVVQLRKHFEDIARATNGMGETTTVISSSGATSVSSSGTATSIQHRSGFTMVSAGTTFIAFSSPIYSAYRLILELFTTENILMPQPTDNTTIPQTANGFSITVSEPTYVKYTAIEIV